MNKELKQRTLLHLFKNQLVSKGENFSKSTVQCVLDKSLNITYICGTLLDKLSMEQKELLGESLLKYSTLTQKDFTAGEVTRKLKNKVKGNSEVKVNWFIEKQEDDSFLCIGKI